VRCCACVVVRAGPGELHVLVLRAAAGPLPRAQPRAGACFDRMAYFNLLELEG